MNIESARSVIVIGGDDPAVVKALLAIRATGATTPVVAELSAAKTARSVRQLFEGRVAIVSGDATIGDLTAEACRQRGLAQVFRALLDFDRDEIYMAEFPELVGSGYSEAQLAFEHCAVMGVLTASGVVELNPPATTTIGDGDLLIAVAEDDSKFTYTGLKASKFTAPAREAAMGQASRRSLLIGWSALGPRVVAEIDKYAGSGTTLEILVDGEQNEIEALRASLDTRRLTLRVTAVSGGPEEVVAQAAEEPFNEVIVLAQRECGSADEADAATLLTLLAVNRIVELAQMPSVRVVAELLDSKNSLLVQATGTDDFVVSDELGSLLIAQISERRELETVFAKLFDYDGAGIVLVSGGAYGVAACKSFADVVAAASSVGHSAIGYRRASDGVVVMNPAKSTALALTDADEVVVLRAAPNPNDAPASSPFCDARRVYTTRSATQKRPGARLRLAGEPSSTGR